MHTRRRRGQIELVRALQRRTVTWRSSSNEQAIFFFPITHICLCNYVCVRVCVCRFFWGVQFIVVDLMLDVLCVYMFVIALI